MRHATRLAAFSAAAMGWYGAGAGALFAQMLSPQADILGLHLGDGIAAAKKKIADGFPGSQSFEVTTTLTTPENKQEYTIGTLFDITTAADRTANGDRDAADRQEAEARARAGLSTGSALDRRVASTGDYGHERLAVLWTAPARSGSSTIFGIGRSKEYLATNRPLATTMIAALTEKYGQPAFENKTDRWNTSKFLFWASSAGIDRNTCFKTNQFPYLYEDSGNYNVVPFEQNAQGMRTDFLGRVNNLHNRNPSALLTKCGSILRVNLQLSEDGVYVKQLNESLVDLTGGQGALIALGDDFFAKVDNAKEQEMQSAGQRKPKL